MKATLGYKRILSLALLLSVLFISCKNEQQASSEEHADVSASDDEWVQMDEFHMLIAESFHPYMDSGNLEPAKKYAGELAAKAEEWSTATLPEKVAREAVKVKLRELAAAAQTMEQYVKTENDSALEKSLVTVHDIFHDVQNEWYATSGEEDHSGHDHH